MRRIAIIHEWLSGYYGSERVLEQILKLYPEADLFCVADFLRPEERTFLDGRQVTTSFIQRLPFARRHFRKYLALMPMAVEQFDLSAHDLVISSSHAVAKGVLTHSGQLHISYVHTPMRYAWDLQEQYLVNGHTKGIRGSLARALLHYMRMWDVRTANGVDVFVVNSSFVARRVWKIYRREAAVVYPPVDVASFAVVIGDGPDLSRLRSKATSNITMLGFQPFDVIRNHLRQARAFIFAAEEDFGIAPVEAQACGTPVIAFGGGGVTETVVDGETGMYFTEQTAESLISAVNTFECSSCCLDPDRIQQNAQRFSIERFRHEFAELVEREYDVFTNPRLRSLSKVGFDRLENGKNVLSRTAAS